jgi:hypothetical protein
MFWRFVERGVQKHHKPQKIRQLKKKPMSKTFYKIIKRKKAFKQKIQCHFFEDFIEFLGFSLHRESKNTIKIFPRFFCDFLALSRFGHYKKKGLWPVAANCEAEATTRAGGQGHGALGACRSKQR